MVIRSGLLLSFAAVFLQIAVFLQPLLPKQYQVAPVCETITRALLIKSSVHSEHHSHPHAVFDHHELVAETAEHHHDASQHCQYCTVYCTLVLPPDLEVKDVLDRIQVRLLAFENAFKHVWFVLQRLLLIPQVWAPPLLA